MGAVRMVPLHRTSGPQNLGRIGKRSQGRLGASPVLAGWSRVSRRLRERRRLQRPNYTVTLIRFLRQSDQWTMKPSRMGFVLCFGDV